MTLFVPVGKLMSGKTAVHELQGQFPGLAACPCYLLTCKCLLTD